MIHRFLFPITLVLLFILNSCCYRQLEGQEKFQVGGIEVVECVGGVSSDMEKVFKRKNVTSAIIINGAHVDKDYDFKIEEDNFRERLKLYLPNKDDNRIVIIDVEGDYMHNMRHSKSKAERMKIMNHYIKIYKFAKKYRPKSQFGFYGFPFREYWSRNDKWIASNNEIIPLLKTVDVLFPSVYDFYTDKIRADGLNLDTEYVKANIQEALRIGSIVNKPVYPFVWHRYHPSNKKNGMQPIPGEEFVRHIQAIANSRYENNHVTGIVWWSAEKYYFNVSEEGIRTRNKNNEFDKVFNDSSYDYLGYIIEGLKQE